MTYEKKIERDEYRKLHLKQIAKLEEELNKYALDEHMFSELSRKIIKMKKQLKLYDKEMGYQKVL